MVTPGHLACGHHGDNLTSTVELTRVKCHSCRSTDVFKEARKDAHNAARRSARKAKKGIHIINDWRAPWRDKFAAMPGLQRLPRGFQGQPFI